MEDLDREIDWTGCGLVERVPGKASGEPIVRGTRILPGPVVRSYDRGESIEQIREDWPSLSVDQVKGMYAAGLDDCKSGAWLRHFAGRGPALHLRCRLR